MKYILLTNLRDVLGVYAVYGVANVLLGRHDQGEGKHTGSGDTVVEPEDPAVYVHVGDVQEPPQLAEYLKHPLPGYTPWNRNQSDKRKLYIKKIAYNSLQKGQG